MKPTADDAEKLLSRSTPQIFRHILDQARDIILVVRSDSKIIYGNQAAAEAYGYSIEELLTFSMQNLRAPEMIPLAKEQLINTFTIGISYRSLHIRKSGKQFPVEVSSKKFHGTTIDAVISIVRDITETVQIEAALQESEQKQQCLNEELIASNDELTAAIEELTAANEELSAANEELSASEEELRIQFIELMEKESKIRCQKEILSALHETSIGLMQRRNPNELLSMIVADANRLVGTEHGFIYILDDEREVFRRTHGLGIYANDIGREIAATDGIVGLVRQTGQPATVNDYHLWKSCNPNSVQFDEIKAVLQIPLKSESKVVGTIGLAYCEEGKKFGEEELSTLSRLAELASMALDNATLINSYSLEVQERREAEASLQAMFNALPDLMFVLHRDGTIVECKTGTDILYRSPELLAGRNVLEIFPPDLAELMNRKIDCAFQTKTVQVFEYQLANNDKITYFEARITVSAVNLVLLICRNITDRKQMEDQLKHLSLHDSLTGCYNRTFFEEEMRRFEKQRNTEVALLICDVDGLKLVNDAFGHDAGDEILKSVADILRKSFRPSDILSRIGGDEFVVLLSSSSVKMYESTCSRIRQHISDYNFKHPHLPISLSLGFSVSRQSPVDMNALFKEADNNMYREKLHQKNSARSAIVQGLVKALEERDFITEGHGDRLQNLIESFARALGLPEHNLPDLRLLAHFHDVGKVGIPDSILFKPGPLSADEWKIMHQHCEIGHRIAMSTPDLSPIANWILKHQEWWNGEGYPLGLRRESIPLECRILSIVDAFDAMTSDRPYRKALALSTATSELRRCAGTQFDPQLVDKFTSLVMLN